MNNESVPAPKE